MDEKKRNSIVRRLGVLKEAARAADQGIWRRDHGVITSYNVDRAEEQETTIGFMEMSPKGQQDYWPYSKPTDYTQSAKNTRYFVAAMPRAMIKLIEDLEELLT